MNKSGWSAIAAGLVLVVLLALLIHHVSHTHEQGVQCDDSTADTGRMQSAIDDSEAGDEIVFHGPCLVDETIVLRGERSYRGQSSSTKIIAAPGSNLTTVLASDSWADNRRTTGEPLSLRDLTIDANRDENPRSGDAVTIRSWRSQIENLRIYDARASCLRLTSRARNGSDLEETSTQVAGTIRGLFVFKCGANGIYVEDKVNAVTDWFMLDNVIGETGEDGIAMENAGGWTIRGNHTFDSDGSGIDVFRLFSTSIADNIVEDFGTGSGVKAYLQGSSGSVITANKIFQVDDRQGGALLEVIGAREGTSTASITGNVIRGNGSGTGISYRTEGAQLNVTSQGNSISQVDTAVTGATPNKGY